MKGLLKKIKYKLLYKNQKSIFNKQEKKKLLERMDQDNFNFLPDEEEKMINQWLYCNSESIYPSRLKEIFDGNDAFAMNSVEAAEMTFKLPYGWAYEMAQKGEYNSLIDWALNSGIAFQNKTILDAGCGFGGLLNALRDRFPSSTFLGIECANSASQMISKKRPWIKMNILSIEGELCVIKQKFPHEPDIIFCTEVLEHLGNPQNAVKNLLSIKKKEGSLILTVPNGRLDHAAQHINFWSPESWKIFIENIALGHKIEFSKTPSPNAPGGHNLCSIIH